MHPSPPRLAIVTGAGGGLGRAFCRRLAARGDCHVVVVDADEAAGAQTLSELRAMPGCPCPGESIRVDVSDRVAWQMLAERLADELAQGKYSAPSLLVNNAGI